MRQNPHVRICGGPGSATTLVYPTDIRHDCEADDLRRTVEITKGIVNHQRLRGRTSRLKPIYSDNAGSVTRALTRR